MRRARANALHTVGVSHKEEVRTERLLAVELQAGSGRTLVPPLPGFRRVVTLMLRKGARS